MSRVRQYCTFTLDRQSYGLDVLRVQEIIRTQPMTPVPLAPPVVRGLMNLRGQIVTAIDLRRMLDLPDIVEAASQINVVVHTDEGAVSLLVDDIGDVLELSDDSFEKPPETLNGTARGLILGVYKLDGVLLHILDVNRAVSLNTVETNPLAVHTERGAISHA